MAIKNAFNGYKSDAQIYMDFANARLQAEKIERAAANVRRESRRFTDCRNDVAAAWSGDNAARFTGKMGMVSEDLEKIARNLERTADAIRRTAKAIYDAEMEAKRIAAERSYGGGGKGAPGGGGGGGGH